MSENHLNTFSGGMNKDASFLSIQQGEYVDAKNAVYANFQQGSIDGNSTSLMSLTNEPGFESFSDFFTKKPDHIILNFHPIQDKIIVFSVETTISGTDYVVVSSEVGILSNLNSIPIYTTILNDLDTSYRVGAVVPSGDTFNFNINYPIRSEARINFNSNIIVYWTDNLNPPRLLDINIDYTINKIENLQKQTTLFSIAEPAVVQYRGQGIGGQIQVGVYQFAVRYLNSSLDPQTFSSISNIIPVVNEEASTEWKQYDGANFDASLVNKTIQLTIENIDTTYDFIELAVIYYTVAASNPQVAIVNRFNVTTSTLNVEFTGEVEQESTLDELLAAPISYSQAKYITQKDGRLFLANLKTNQNPDITELVKDLEVRYVVEDIEVQRGGDEYTYFPPVGTAKQDYKNEELTFNKKGLKRDEVYSIAIVPIYQDNTEGFAYHIPADITVPNPTIDTLGPTGSSGLYSEGRLGAWSSSLNYPTGSAYGAGSILHHKMPSNVQQPHFYRDTVNNITYIRVLGLKITNIQAALAANPVLAAAIKGFKVVYQPRNTVQNRSILTQGFLIKSMISEEGTPFTPNFNDRDYSRAIVPAPFSGHFYISYGTADSQPTSPGHNGFFAPYGTVPVSGHRSGAIERVGSFSSPEFLYSNLPVIGNKLKCVNEVQGTLFGANFNSFYISSRFNLTVTNKIRRGAHKAIGINLSYRTPTAQGTPTGNEGTVLTIANQKEVRQNPNVFPHFGHGGFDEMPVDDGTSIEEIYKLYSWQTQDYVAVNTKEAIPNPTSEPRISHVFPIGFVDGAYESSLTNSENTRVHKALLCDYTINNNNQYGNIDNAEYILLDQFIDNYNINLSSDDETSPIFNGDTFINFFVHKRTVHIPIYVKESGGNPYSANESQFRDLVETFAEWKGRFYDPVLSASTDSVDANTTGADRFDCWLGTWVESTINTGYIHSIDEENITDSSRYYPKHQAFEYLFKPPIFKEGTNYNVQYSKLNDLKTFFSPALGFQQLTQFPTRIIYSQDVLEGEQSDRMRIFLPNNYTDLPKHKGEITNIFVHNNTIFAHTERSLFRTFVNQTQGIQTTDDTLVLGTGQIFSIPSQEILDLNGGYAGCLHDFSGVSTPFGFIFVDYNQKKVFLLQDGLAEISQQGMFKFFQDNLNIPYNANRENPLLPTYNPNYRNNPNNINATGVISYYDPLHRRVVISIKQTPMTGTNQFKTISFSLLNNKWVSLHDYSPAVVTSIDNKIISTNNNRLQMPNINQIYLHNSQLNYNRYYDNTYYPKEIEVLIAPNPLQSKVFDVVLAYLDAYTINNIPLPYDFYQTLKAYNDRHNTGDATLAVRDNNAVIADEFDYNVKRVTDHYRLQIPRSRVNNEELSPLDNGNLIASENRESRLRGTWIKLRLIDSSDGTKALTLHSLITIFRPSFR